MSLARLANGQESLPTKVSDHQSKRFPRSSVKILKRWLSANALNPHPTEGQKRLLQEQTGLTTQQISTWFANARRRGLAKPANNTQLYTSNATASISAPNVSTVNEWGGLSPFERWRNSPPEDEPASFTAINNAITSSSGLVTQSAPVNDVAVDRFISTNVVRTHSETSFESLSSFWTSGSSSSAQSVSSDLHLTNSREVRREPNIRHTRRRKSLAKHKITTRRQRDADNARPFQCTFCTDTFKTKYDWTRHEGTLHLNLEKWICTPQGPTYQNPLESFLRCAFCDEPDPSTSHISCHNYDDCIERPAPEREFRRKDHLRQHLRIVHSVDTTPSTFAQWKTTIANVKSRCGFCGERFTLWSDRNDHLGDHFRNGWKMKDWKADRGLESSICLMVENAMPPYLIGAESNEFEPFSASRNTQGSISDPITSRAAPTRFEDLTAKLADYVNAAIQGGTLVTDEVVRRQARLIMFGDDDAWNQTPADNAEWLRLFKSALGLGGSSSSQQSSPNPPAQSQPAFSEALQMRWPFGPFNNCKTPLPWIWQAPECLAEFRQNAIEGQWLPTVSGDAVTVPQLPSTSGESIDDFLNSIGASQQQSPIPSIPIQDLTYSEAHVVPKVMNASTDELQWAFTTDDLEFYGAYPQLK